MGVPNAHAISYPPMAQMNYLCQRGSRLRCPRSEREQLATSADDRHSIAERGRAELALADPRAGPFDSTRTSVAPMLPEDSEAVQDTSSSLLLAEVGVIRLWVPPPADVPHRRPQAWEEIRRATRAQRGRPALNHGKGPSRTRSCRPSRRVLGLDRSRSYAAGGFRGSSRRPQLAATRGSRSHSPLGSPTR